MTGLVLPPMDRHSAIAWAKRVIGDRRTVFLDSETTWLDRTGEIVDIAVIAGNGTILLNQFVRPVRAIPPDATRIHGITDVDVATAATWDDVWRKLTILLGDRTVVVYNAEYDYKMIQQCNATGITPLPVGVWHCAMKAFAAFQRVPSHNGRGYRWFKLEDAVRSFRIPEGGHRALADAEACRRLERRADNVTIWQSVRYGHAALDRLP